MEWDEDEIEIEVVNDVVEVEIAETAGTDVSIDEEKIELEIAAPEENTLEITDDLIELELIDEPEIVLEVGEGKAVWGGITGELPDQTDLQTALDGKSDVGHIHDDRYYTEQEIDAALAVINAALSGKSDVGHVHDDRYYTQGEIDGALAVINAALSGKSDVGHTHDDRYYTESEVNTKLQTNSNNDNYVHNAIGSGSKVELNTLIESPDGAGFMGIYNDGNTRKINYISAGDVVRRIGAAASSHNHDSRYYTETETDTKLSGKSNTDHTHDERYARNTIGAGSSIEINTTVEKTGTYNYLTVYRDGDVRKINYITGYHLRKDLGTSLPLIKYKIVTVGNLTIGPQGYISIASFKPAAPSADYTLFGAFYRNWSSNGGNAIQISLDGEWVQGTPNQQVLNLQLTFYWILRSDEAAA